MKKNTYHFVQIFYRIALMPYVYGVAERNAEQVEYNPDITYFRFFDLTETTLDNGKIIVGEPENFSKKICFGERNYVIHMMEYEDAIKFHNGTILLHPVGYITVDEYKQQVSKETEKTNNEPKKVLKVRPRIVKKNKDRINK